jgi:hypothetical protein
VEKERKEAEAAEERSELKLVLTKGDGFIAVMTDWYVNLLRNSERDRLTKKRLLRRAVLEAQRLKMPFNKLPKDWIQTLKNTCGLRILVKSRTLEVKFPSLRAWVGKGCTADIPRAFLIRHFRQFCQFSRIFAKYSLFSAKSKARPGPCYFYEILYIRLVFNQELNGQGFGSEK